MRFGFIKRGLTLLILTVIIISATACTVTDRRVSYSGRTYTTTNKNIGVYIASASEKVFREEAYAGNGELGVNINAVKNEIESGQFIIRNDDADMTGVSAHISEVADGNGNTVKAEIYREYYVCISHVKNTEAYYSPDALVPLFDGENGNNSVTVGAGCNQAFYISVRTDEDTVPGEYNGTVTVNTDCGDVSVPVTVTVNDVTLPDVPTEKTFMTTFGINGKTGCSGVYADYGADGWDMLYEFLLNRRLNIHMMPHTSGYSLEDYKETLRKYAFDERIQLVYFPYFCSDTVTGTPTEGELNKQKYWYNEIKEFGERNGCPELVDKLYLSPERYDELNGINDTARSIAAKTFCDAERANIPDINIALTLGSGENIMYGSLPTWVLNYDWTSEEIEIIRNSGAENLWCYGSEGLLIGLDDNVTGKTLFWTQHKYGIDGYLAWAVDNYMTEDPLNDAIVDDIRDFWNNPYNYQDEAEYMTYGGDGMLVYAGTEDDGIVNRNIICSCLRLEQICDGVDDYDLLTIRENQIEARLKEFGITDMTPRDFMNQYYDAFNTRVDTASGDTYSEAEKYDIIRKKLIDDIVANDKILISVKQDISENEAVNCQSRTVTVIGDCDSVTVNGNEPEQIGKKYITDLYIIGDLEYVTVEADFTVFEIPIFTRRKTDVIVVSDYINAPSDIADKTANAELTDSGLKLNFGNSETFTLKSSLWTEKIKNWKNSEYLAIKVTNTGSIATKSTVFKIQTDRNFYEVKDSGLDVGECKVFSLPIDSTVLSSDAQRLLIVTDKGAELTVEYFYLFNVD